VDIFVHISDMELSEVQALTEAAHQVCPYSKATRGNIPVNIHVN
jgi:organic hydroperoxide reductase OsmC/OhrA